MKSTAKVGVSLPPPDTDEASSVIKGWESVDAREKESALQRLAEGLSEAMSDSMGWLVDRIGQLTTDTGAAHTNSKALFV